MNFDMYEFCTIDMKDTIHVSEENKLFFQIIHFNCYVSELLRYLP